MAACLALAGCGPRTAASILFPKVYSVRSTVDLTRDGVTRRQTLVHRCKITDMRHSIAGTRTASWRGDAHWFAEADGAIFLAPVQPCAFYSDMKVGDVLDLSEQTHPIESLLIRDRSRPEVIDVFDTNELVRTGQLRGRLEVTHMAAPSRSLAAAFPGLSRFHPNSQMSALGPPSASAFAYLGATARIYQLAPGTTCGEPSAEPQVLSAGSRCTSINRCSGVGDATSVCGRELGDIAPRPSPDFQRVEVQSDQPAVQAFRGRFWSSASVLHQSPTTRSSGRWTPEVCVDDLCESLPSTGMLYFYRPTDRRLVEVLITGRTITRSLFTR